jgi:hypothetical protein
VVLASTALARLAAAARRRAAASGKVPR